MANINILSESDPETYVEFLRYKKNEAPRRNQADTATSIETPQGIDQSLAPRVCALIEAVAGCLVPTREDVVAVAASFVQTPVGTKTTTIYIAYNQDPPELPEPFLTIESYLRSIIADVYDLPIPPKKPNDDSPDMCEGEDTFIEALDRLSAKIYRVCWDRWTHHLGKKERILKLQKAIALLDDNENMGVFTDEQWIGLKTIFEDIQRLIERFGDKPSTSASNAAQAVAVLYKKWSDQHWLYGVPHLDPKHHSHGNPEASMLAKFEKIYDAIEGTYFSIRRWLVKLVSFRVHILEFVRLALSSRLRPFFDTGLKVQVVSAPKSCIEIDVRKQTIGKIVDITRERFKDTPTTSGRKLGDSYHDRHVREFVDKLFGRPKGLKCDTVVWDKAVLHCELVLLSHFYSYPESSPFGYMAVTKLSCVSCQRYLEAYNSLVTPSIYTRGSHGKFYTPWRFPTLKNSPELDAKIRSTMLRSLQDDLVKLLIDHLTASPPHGKQASDSSVESLEHGAIVSNHAMNSELQYFTDIQKKKSTASALVPGDQ